MSGPVGVSGYTAGGWRSAIRADFERLADMFVPEAPEAAVSAVVGAYFFVRGMHGGVGCVDGECGVVGRVAGVGERVMGFGGHDGGGYCDVVDLRARGELEGASGKGELLDRVAGGHSGCSGGSTGSCGDGPGCGHGDSGSRVGVGRVDGCCGPVTPDGVSQGWDRGSGRSGGEVGHEPGCGSVGVEDVDSGPSVRQAGVGVMSRGPNYERNQAARRRKKEKKKRTITHPTSDCAIGSGEDVSGLGNEVDSGLPGGVVQGDISERRHCADEVVPEWRRRSVAVGSQARGFFSQCDEEVRRELRESRARRLVAENELAAAKAKAEVSAMSGVVALVTQLNAVVKTAAQLEKNTSDERVKSWAKTVVDSAISELSEKAPSSVPSLQSVGASSSASQEKLATAATSSVSRAKLADDKLFSQLAFEGLDPENPADAKEINRRTYVRQAAEKALRQTAHWQ